MAARKCGLYPQTQDFRFRCRESETGKLSEDGLTAPVLAALHRQHATEESDVMAPIMPLTHRSRAFGVEDLHVQVAELHAIGDCTGLDLIRRATDDEMRVGCAF